jgi:hypothetical protein
MCVYIYIYMRVRGYMYILINIYKLSLNKQVDPYTSEFTNNNRIELNLYEFASFNNKT